MNDLGLFLILDDNCGGLLAILKLVYNVINILRIIIPIILILLGTIDLGKAVIASDDKEIKTAQSLLIKRLIYAAAIFFVPMLVYVIMNLVFNANDTTSGGAQNSNSFQACWQQITGQSQSNANSNNGSSSGSRSNENSYTVG